MNEEEKDWMLILLDAVEHLFSENAALRVTLEHHHVSAQTYERECRELMNHTDHIHLVRAKFADLRAYIEQTPDLSKAVQELLKALPKSDQSN
jgi:hypothetical protein